MHAVEPGPIDVSGRDRIIGFFVFGALLSVLTLFFSPWLQQMGERDSVVFVTYLDNTYGIQKDASVNFKGVTIGSVSAVQLNPQGQVTVEISLSNKYEDFYTLGSQLIVDSEIGVTSILNGIGLTFISGTESRERLADGDELVTIVPLGLASILERFDVELIVTQLGNIITSTEEITAGFSANQASLYQTVSNLQSITAGLNEVSAGLPDLLKSIKQSARSFEATAHGAQRIMNSSEADLISTLENTATLTEQATATLKKTEQLISAGHPIAESLPELIEKTELALDSVDELAQTMNRSWLFSGRKKKEKNEAGGQD
jgi:phospholipid/cholesterol/gamma-HCH transport system substrate-binding protein